MRDRKDDEEMRLDVAFAQLMNYTPEPEEPSPNERRPRLRYRYPRGADRVVARLGQLRLRHRKDL